jgi:hypothetical protein
VWVRERSGERVDLWARGGVNQLIRMAGRDPGTYPLLTGVDSYGVTIFNSLQCRRLRQELQHLVDDMKNTDDAYQTPREAALALQQLADIVDNPPHRQLWFIGD